MRLLFLLGLVVWVPWALVLLTFGLTLVAVTALFGSDKWMEFVSAVVGYGMFWPLDRLQVFTGTYLFGGH